MVCAEPSPNTSRRIATMRGKENSSPSVNSRNTTPISRDGLGLGAFRKHRECKRPEHNADDQITEDRRHADAPGQRQHQHRREQQYQDLAEGLLPAQRDVTARARHLSIATVAS